MKYALAPLVLLIALSACGPKSKTPSAATPPATLNLVCGPPFTFNTSKASLIATYGAANVADQTVPGPEGEDLKATVLFPNDPKRRVVIAWGDEATQTHPSDVAIEGEVSDWIGPHGLKLGATLEQVEKINGRPFTLSGFGWDYGGYPNSWKGGALERDAQGCGVTIRFDPARGVNLEGISGDATFASNAPATRAAHAKIARLSIGYPMPEPAQ